MAKLTQRVINKQIGSGGFKPPAKCCGKNVIQQSLISGVPIPNEPPEQRPLILGFDAIGNAPVVNPASVAQWNTFFGLPANGTPFTSVQVIGNEVRLYGGSGITMAVALFSSSSGLVSIIDVALCVVAVGQLALSGVATLTNITLNACLNFALNSCDQNVSLTTISATAGTDFGDACFEGNTALTTPITLPSAINIGASCFNGCNLLATISLPVCTNLGGTVGDDNVFGTSAVTQAGGVLTIPIALMTVDAGNPDGDIQAVISGGGTVVTV